MCSIQHDESLCTLPTYGGWALVLRGLEVKLLIYLDRDMRDAAFRVRRISLPRTPVNRGWVTKF